MGGLIASVCASRPEQVCTLVYAWLPRFRGLRFAAVKLGAFCGLRFAAGDLAFTAVSTQIVVTLCFVALDINIAG